ncbi:MAG: lysophospholipid acyltransferase family protein [Thermodesulfobacteriota bacterium]|nr:lysophospholipid acyltransferase family protein [Thermodesulfobacteriota bacterium]
MGLYFLKDGLKKFRYLVEAVSFFITSRLIAVIPLRIHYGMGRALGKILYFFPYFKNRIKKNLKIAYEDDCPQTEKIIHGIGENLCLSFMETASYSLSKIKQKSILENITVQGRDNIDKALNQGKGVLLVTAHLGNFTLLFLKLRREGYPIHTVVKGSNNPFIAKQFHTFIDRIEVPYIPVEPGNICLKKIRIALQGNGIVAFLVDEKRRRDGIYVDFFGKPASTTRGPATISLRSGASIIPAFIVRNLDNTHDLFIEEPIQYTNNSLSQNEKVFFLTQQYSQVVEKYIRRYPDLWSWTSNKWKLPRANQDKKSRGKFFHFGLTSERKD